jgi:regulator of nucleoside diphosphate kinase
LLCNQDSRAWGDSETLDKLETILEGAQPLEPSHTPKTLVTMNTTVRLVELPAKTCRNVTLVYPVDMDVVSNGVSILDPLGTALLGCNVGDVIQCPAGNCRRRFRVSGVVYQPEQAGASH